MSFIMEDHHHRHYERKRRIDQPKGRFFEDKNEFMYYGVLFLFTASSFILLTHNFRQ
jgi:hypothetical protein